MQISLLYCNDQHVARFGARRKEFPPIGLLYLGAALELQGINVSLHNIADVNFSIADLPEKGLIGLSVNSSYVFPSFIEIANKVRDKADLLIIGGQHVTLFPEISIKELKADYALLGEGEYTLPQLVIAYYENEIKHVCKNQGYAYYADGQFLNNGNAPRIVDLDALPFPARHLLPNDDILLDGRFSGTGILSVSMITSRGCPYQCTFCANVNRGFACRSAENVGKEITSIRMAYPAAKGIVFLDENLLASKSHIEELCDTLRTSDMKWMCNARVDCINQSIVEKMAESGCTEIKFGVESGSQRMLDIMQKGISIQESANALRITHEAGIGVKCFLLYGYKSDNLESAKETIAFLDENRRYIDRVNLFDFAPLPNSASYSELPASLAYNWRGFKIYNGLMDWWGDEDSFRKTVEGYRILKQYIAENFGE